MDSHILFVKKGKRYSISNYFCFFCGSQHDFFSFCCPKIIPVVKLDYLVTVNTNNHRKENVLNITDVIIDARKTLGTQMLLVDVRPVFEYKNGKKSDNITGYKYEICLPERMFEKISVKILGSQRIEKPECGSCEVDFVNLELYIYWMANTYHIGARASDIKNVSTK